jgi:hypothetical protein
MSWIDANGIPAALEQFAARVRRVALTTRWLLEALRATAPSLTANPESIVLLGHFWDPDTRANITSERRIVSRTSQSCPRRTKGTASRPRSSMSAHPQQTTRLDRTGAVQKSGRTSVSHAHSAHPTRPNLVEMC